jgi:hypothetical protein
MNYWETEELRRIITEIRRVALYMATHPNEIKESDYVELYESACAASDVLGLDVIREVLPRHPPAVEQGVKQ